MSSRVCPHGISLRFKQIDLLQLEPNLAHLTLATLSLTPVRKKNSLNYAKA